MHHQVSNLIKEQVEVEGILLGWIRDPKSYNKRGSLYLQIYQWTFILYFLNQIIIPNFLSTCVLRRDVVAIPLFIFSYTPPIIHHY